MCICIEESQRDIEIEKEREREGKRERERERERVCVKDRLRASSLFIFDLYLHTRNIYLSYQLVNTWNALLQREL